MLQNRILLSCFFLVLIMGCGQGFDQGSNPQKTQQKLPEPSPKLRMAQDKSYEIDFFSGSCQAENKFSPNLTVIEKKSHQSCPPGMVLIAGLKTCIDQYEASLAYKDANGDMKSWSPFFNPGTQKVYALSIVNVYPQSYISGVQAKKACKNSGKRLCSLKEWELACRGTKNLIYPYGNSEKQGTCNDHRKKHPALEYFGKDDPKVWSKLGHPCINQQKNSLLKSAQKRECISAVGAFDMVGNLHEWIEDSSGVFKGGFYADTKINGKGCLYKTTAHSLNYWDYSTGFRCCKEL